MPIYLQGQKRVKQQRQMLFKVGIGLEAAIALKTSEPTTAKANLNQIESVIEQSLQITPTHKTSAGKTIAEWRLPDNNFTWAYS